MSEKEEYTIKSFDSFDAFMESIEAYELRYGQEYIEMKNNRVMDRVLLIVGNNTSLFVGILEYMKDLQFNASSLELEIVDKPEGQMQDEDDYGDQIPKVWVVQYGDESGVGPGFNGDVYIPLPNGQFLKVPFC